MIAVDRERCTGCGACMAVCPSGAIRLVRSERGSYAEVDQAKCRHCEVCLNACPEQAIMSGVKPAIERELVQVDAKPVPVRPQLRQMRPVLGVPKGRALLVAPMVFVGCEILPRVATGLLNAGLATNALGRAGRQRRRRQRRGRG